MSEPLKLGFLCSGRGSNMNAVVDACGSGDLSAQPAVVISNNSGSAALERARDLGIPAYHQSRQTAGSTEALDALILETLIKHGCDLVVLAGYMKKLGPRTLAGFHNRVVNIHPALLPAFGGQGMYGRRVHQAVIAAGEKATGVTIHLVDENYDTGPILAQREVPVREDDTPEALAARLLPIEHAFLVETLARIAAGELALPVT
jgi:phosphoribosylglycinamide formyltransferase-1